MDIYEEIKQREAYLKTQANLQQQQIAAATAAAEKYIPQIVADVRKYAIQCAAAKYKPVYRRGLFGQIKYIQIDYKFSTEDSDLKRQWYLSFVRADETVICRKLAEAIDRTELCNTKVWRNGRWTDPHFCIQTELNI